MEEIMIVSDIEYLVIFSLFFVLFMMGIERRGTPMPLGGIDLDMSNAIKGLACVMILLGHYGQRKFSQEMDWGISKLVWNTSATIALVWFMYFSGYGLSLKKSGSNIGIKWIKRLKKIYIPLLLVSLTSLLLYSILPDITSLEECNLRWLSKDIYYIHNFKLDYLSILIPHAFGWRDWYVCCIIIFYSFFYLSEYLEINTGWNLTVILWVLLVVYFIWAYWYFGPESAHWYRFCWVFFLGHIHAKFLSKEKVSRIDLFLLFFLLVTSIIESKMILLSYFLAIMILLLFICINSKYVIRNKVLLFLGGISYFFYLSHIKIGYALMEYLEINSIIFWVFLTVIISYLFSKLNFLYQK